jgi:hypothetical protein
MRRKGSIVRILAAACLGGFLLAGPLFAGTPKADDVKKMEEALPAKAPAAPKKARKVLVYGNAQGFVHSSIELGEETIAKMGEKTGAYTAVINNDPAVFDDLSPYDAIMLVSTTGHFLLPKTMPADKAKADEYKAKEKERFANMIKFVKDGKGLAGIHAASDAYYDFPEWGETIGGYFNGHPFQKVTVKIDDPKSPITAGFEGKSFDIQDETYTFKKVPWSRDKLHILTSLDISGMPADKKDPTKKQGENRDDHDYGISWIHEVGKGRVFYCAHGHSEHVYWDKPMLMEYLAGLQYALGDLEADATPSAGAKTATAK